MHPADRPYPYYVTLRGPIGVNRAPYYNRCLRAQTTPALTEATWHDTRFPLRPMGTPVLFRNHRGERLAFVRGPSSQQWASYRLSEKEARQALVALSRSSRPDAKRAVQQILATGTRRGTKARLTGTTSIQGSRKVLDAIFRGGRFQVFVRPTRANPISLSAQTDAEKVEPPEHLTYTVEVQMVDAYGEPVTDIPFKVRTPDGIELRAQQGQVRQVGLPVSGVCDLILPNHPKSVVKGSPRIRTDEPHRLEVLCAYVRLDMDPGDKDDADLQFRLFSKDGSYEKTLSLANDRIKGDGFVDLRYTATPESSTYSLEVLDPGAEENIAILQDMGYSALSAKPACV